MTRQNDLSEFDVISRFHLAILFYIETESH